MQLEAEQFVEDVFTAVRGLTDRFDRKWYLETAKNRASTSEMWKHMASQGLLGIGVPEEHGGSGGGVTGAVAVMEAMSRVGVPSFLYIVTAFGLRAILHAGTEEQKQRWVPPIVAGDRRTCFALTEPNAGTNSFNMSTRAERTAAGTYRLTGQKTFISGADEANSMMVVARAQGESGPDFSLFIVELPTARPHAAANGYRDVRARTAVHRLLR